MKNARRSPKQHSPLVARNIATTANLVNGIAKNPCTWAITKIAQGTKTTVKSNVTDIAQGTSLTDIGFFLYIFFTGSNSMGYVAMNWNWFCVLSKARHINGVILIVVTKFTTWNKIFYFFTSRTRSPNTEWLVKWKIF